MDDPADPTGGWPVALSGDDVDAVDGPVALSGDGVDAVDGPLAPGSRDPAAVLRWSLLGWGLGHVVLGMRRGWLLLALEAAWLVALVALVISPGVLVGEGWLLVFGLFTGFVMVWTGQAVDAHRTASRLAGADPGAMQLLVILFVTMVVQTGYWVVGGATASPEATLQRYVSAWETGQPGRAAGLFTTPHDASAVAEQWTVDTATIASLVDQLAKQHDDWDLDTLRPYRDLRFERVAGETAPGRAYYAVEVVRQTQLPTTFLGFTTTRSATQVVDVVGHLSLVQRTSGASLPFLGQPAVWLIEDVAIRG
jgi:hypothetical protein